MQHGKVLLGVLVFLAWVVPAGAVEMRGELVLIKGPVLELDTFLREPVCESFLDFRIGEDQPNFFNYRDRNCMGRYSFTLRGKPGTTVTLFAKINYGTERGFLIVRKLDDQTVWLDNLESLPPGQWVSREAQGGYGAYAVYYSPGPQFSQNIASVRWGEWWRENPQAPVPPPDASLETGTLSFLEVLP